MTVYGLGVLLGAIVYGDLSYNSPYNYWRDAEDVAACSWSKIKFADSELLGVFSSGDAECLIKGRKVDPPTCPQCCVMMDLALEMRARWLAEAQTQR